MKNKGQIKQICVVVNDVKRAMKNYWELLGIGPWDVRHFTQDKMKGFTVGGKLVKEDFDFICAVTWVGDMEFELIEPVKGPNIYREFLDTKGEGLHHFKYVIPNDDELAEFVKSLEAKGYTVTQTGWIDNDVHYYVNTDTDMGMVLELGNGGKIGAPDYVYPADAKRDPDLRVPNYKQVCVMVKDADKAIKRFYEVLGFGPWTVRHFTPKSLEYLKVDGQKVKEDFDFICAVTWVGDVEFEITQPIKGPLVYWDHMAKKGESLHHIKDVMSNEDLKKYIEYFKSKGYKVLQAGKIDEDIHAYINTESSLSMTLELGNGKSNGAPDYVYPPESQK